MITGEVVPRARNDRSFLYRVETRCMVTAVIQPPRHCGHPGQSQIISIAAKCRTFSPTNMVTSLFRSLWPSLEGDLNSDVSLYYDVIRQVLVSHRRVL